MVSRFVEKLRATSDVAAPIVLVVAACLACAGGEGGDPATAADPAAEGAASPPADPGAGSPPAYPGYSDPMAGQGTTAPPNDLIQQELNQQMQNFNQQIQQMGPQGSGVATDCPAGTRGQWVDGGNGTQNWTCTPEQTSQCQGSGPCAGVAY